jgi:hypothetical protein
MIGDESAYAVLGLEPGADAAAIDQAYRTLIKLHHPDREGGDAEKAKEIIHAYRELRGSAAFKNPLVLVQEPERPSGRRRWRSAVLAFVAAGGLFLIARGPIEQQFRIVSTGVTPRLKGVPVLRAAVAEPMDQPLHLKAIDAAIRDATYLSRTKDEMALASASSDCQTRFRGNPTLDLLDRCAAFDDAAVVVENRDPLRDQGPFAELAVTGRQWSAASSLSSDYLAVDSRLDRIRLRVELAIAEAQDAADARAAAAKAPPTENSADENVAD